MSEKKRNQLGMNPSTASHRLVKDILWKLIVNTKQDSCCKCGVIMTRENFSIEHLTPWMDSEDPVGIYFDLNNISFSHLGCNVADKRDTRVLKPCGTHQSYDRGCRCVDCKLAKSIFRKGLYSSKKRKEKYRSNGT